MQTMTLFDGFKSFLGPYGDFCAETDIGAKQACPHHMYSRTSLDDLGGGGVTMAKKTADTAIIAKKLEGELEDVGITRKAASIHG